MLVALLAIFLARGFFIRWTSRVKNISFSHVNLEWIFQNTHKSIGSNDTSSNSGSTAAATATPTNEDNSSDETTRENGRGSNSGHESNEGSEGVDVVGNHNNDEQHKGNGNINDNQNQKGLNLKMSAKELRARLAARKKYDPKKESIGFKDKFDIIQKL